MTDENLKKLEKTKINKKVLLYQKNLKRDISREGWTIRIIKSSLFGIIIGSIISTLGIAYIQIPTAEIGIGSIDMVPDAKISNGINFLPHFKNFGNGTAEHISYKIIGIFINATESGKILSKNSIINPVYPNVDFLFERVTIDEQNMIEDENLALIFIIKYNNKSIFKRREQTRYFWFKNTIGSPIFSYLTMDEKKKIEDRFAKLLNE